MLNKFVVPDLRFDFDTIAEFELAKKSGFIPDYYIMRIKRVHKDNWNIDYPCHSKEQFIAEVQKWIGQEDLEVFESYYAIHCYDIHDNV